MIRNIIALLAALLLVMFGVAVIAITDHGGWQFMGILIIFLSGVIMGVLGEAMASDKRQK